MLRPGEDTIAHASGLHTWMQWDRPILTDSGGFQVFSLSKLNSIDQEGVSFRSHIDGSLFRLSPKRAIEIQEKLGADIIMAFDECAPADADKAYTKAAMDRTHQWLKESKKAHTRKDQALFGIIQGGTFMDLRKESAEFVKSCELPGIAIGGVAVGEGKEKMWEVVETIAPLLPENKPHYLMGVGEPEDLVRGVAAGIDMFDCVIPTRLARHGTFWCKKNKTHLPVERISILKTIYKQDSAPLDRYCACYTCARFTRSYLHHLMREGEMLGARLLTIHNLHFLLDLMRTLRSKL